jgi:hexosaminidase
MTIRILPQPKQLMRQDGAFTISSRTAIIIPAESDDESFFLARQIQQEIVQATSISPPIYKTSRAPQKDELILLLRGEDQSAVFGVAPFDARAPENVADQSFSLSIKPALVAIQAEGASGLFYAGQTLRQLVRLEGATLPCLSIQDWPSLPYRGLMLDISRRKVPTLDTLFQLVEELSFFKLNLLQLYTEHTFQFPRHPKIGAGCGSLSSEDILDLDAHCRARFVELVPNLQSFGHARNTLKIPDYQHLAETDALFTLSPAFEETYTLLDELYGDMLPAFTSKTLNINCDETYDLGRGASKSMADELGLGRVYLNHILRVRDLAARYGWRIQAWGDILLHHPELIGEVPDDVTLLDWHYDPADEYPSVKIFESAGRRFWVCPGVGSWNSIIPRIYGANVNIRNFVRDGVTSGAEGMLNTDWGDAGHYQALGLSWYGYAFGAAQGWSGGTTSDADFENAFGPLFFGPEHPSILQALHQLADTNELPNVHRNNRSHTVLALFDEPLTGATISGDGALPEETLHQMLTLAESAVATCDGLAAGHPRELTLREMASAARLTAYGARKTTMSQAIRAHLSQIATQPEPVDENAQLLYDDVLKLKALDAELEELRAEFETLWCARARRSEIQFSLRYFASLRIRYQAAIAWLLLQRDRLLAGSPVDAELETYEVTGHHVLWHSWQEKSIW